MKRFGPHLCFSLCVFCLPGCRTFGPPTEAFLATLVPPPPARCVRQRLEVSVRSKDLTGEFHGALVASRGRDARVRLQLFPDVGGKVLDLAVTPRRIEAFLADTGEHFAWTLPPTRPLTPTLPLLLGVTLGEHFSDLDPQRITGVRPYGSGWQLRLTRHPSGVEVFVNLDAARAVTGRTYEYGMLAWEERGGDPLTFLARGSELTLRTVEEESLAEVPEALFSVGTPR